MKIQIDKYLNSRKINKCKFKIQSVYFLNSKAKQYVKCFVIQQYNVHTYSYDQRNSVLFLCSILSISLYFKNISSLFFCLYLNFRFLFYIFPLTHKICIYILTNSQVKVRWFCVCLLKCDVVYLKIHIFEREKSLKTVNTPFFHPPNTVLKCLH